MSDFDVWLAAAAASLPPSLLVVLVLQEWRGRRSGAGPLCAALWRCVVLRWLRMEQTSGANPPPLLSFETHIQAGRQALSSLPHPKYPSSPSGLNNFPQAKTGSIWLHVYAADRCVCRHLFFFLSPPWVFLGFFFAPVSAPVFPCIMHRHIPRMSLQNCLLTEWPHQELQIPDGSANSTGFASLRA